MINKCKVQIGIIELYNVIESHNEKGGKNGIQHSRNRTFCGVSILVFLFLQQHFPYFRPTKLTEAKFFDPSSTSIHCELYLGPGLDQKSLGQEIVQLQLAPSVGELVYQLAQRSSMVEPGPHQENPYQANSQ